MKLQVCSINEYVHLCYRRPQFGLALSWLAVQEAITCAEHAINTGRRTPPERLAHFLLEIYSRLEAVGLASEDSFDLPFSQEVMSDVLGLSVPHLNRTLAKLRSDGLIEVAAHRIRLRRCRCARNAWSFPAAQTYAQSRRRAARRRLMTMSRTRARGLL